MNKKQFDRYCNRMWKRLKMGEKKYGTSYRTMDVQEELAAELIDVSNYAFMLYLRAMEIAKKYKKELNTKEDKK